MIWLGIIFVQKGLGDAAEEVKESTASVQMAVSMREENVGFAAAVDTAGARGEGGRRYVLHDRPQQEATMVADVI